jgi:hypothetical protein
VSAVVSALIAAVPEKNARKNKIKAHHFAVILSEVTGPAAAGRTRSRRTEAAAAEKGAR